jgi:hypothetical protein
MISFYPFMARSRWLPRHFDPGGRTAGYGLEGQARGLEFSVMISLGVAAFLSFPAQTMYPSM